MILEALRSELIASQKNKEPLKLDVLRYLMSAIKNREIELRPQNLQMTDEEVLKVLKKQIKQRNDSIENYKNGKRDDLVQKETQEKSILEEYLNKFLPQS